MPKYTEETLDSWRKPASETEDQKIANAISMIKDAIHSDKVLKDKNIEFIVQGSYGNNTNIRIDSDVDVCAMLKDTFYSEYRTGVTKEDYGFIDSSNSYSNYKKAIVDALVRKFGEANVKVGNKAIEIKSNTYRVQADVVAAFQYRNYTQDIKNDPENFVEGVKFYALDSQEIINYPKIHVSNGIKKNDATGRRYKRCVRLYKRIRNAMIDSGLPVPSNMKSFLIEGLLWNTPNATFTNTKTWNDLLRETIIFLYNKTKDDASCKDWGEVSEKFYLFHSDRKWTRNDVNVFLYQMWNFLEYK